MVFPSSPPKASSQQMEISGLTPDPGVEWKRLLKFVDLNAEDEAAMASSAETLMQRAHELVVGTYNYLSSVPETAAILGWESKIDEAHLAERRRFFAVWLNRTLGLDKSCEFADYLFGAGKLHAGHGPRQIHVTPNYVSGSIGLVLASFATYMKDAKLPIEIVAGAMAGWSKYLTVQTHLMDLGYRVALEWDDGDFPVEIELYGRIRPLVGQAKVVAHCRNNKTVADLLRNFFNYYPQTRTQALEHVWHSEDDKESLWLEVTPAYIPKGGWRVLLNGRDLNYAGGFQLPVNPNDKIAIFPPGR
jgi:molybdopterin converting factor small subunit